MSDYYSGDVKIELSGGKDTWSVARDVEAMMEGAMVSAWLKSEKSYEAETDSRIWFRDTDLTGLRAKARDHGGRLDRLRLDADFYYPEGGLLALDVTIWIEEDESREVWIHWSSPLRVDADRILNALRRMHEAYSRRSLWSESTFTAGPIAVTTDASEEVRHPRAAVSGARLRTRSWRWFVRNRDSIIITLVGGIIVTGAFAVVGLLT